MQYLRSRDERQQGLGSSSIMLVAQASFHAQFDLVRVSDPSRGLKDFAVGLLSLPGPAEPYILGGV